MKHKKSIKKISTRFLCWILLLQMINISLDQPDSMRYSIVSPAGRENLSINEMESFYELLSEGFFQKDVPESDDHDVSSYVEIFDFYHLSIIDTKIIISDRPISYNRFIENNFAAHFPEFNAPPPKYI